MSSPPSRYLTKTNGRNGKKGTNGAKGKDGVHRFLVLDMQGFRGNDGRIFFSENPKQ